MIAKVMGADVSGLDAHLVEVEVNFGSGLPMALGLLVADGAIDGDRLRDYVLVGAMNPCPCGFLGDSLRPCRCTSVEIRRHRSRVSGPLLDRIDMHVDVPAVSTHEVAQPADAEPSAPFEREW